MAGEFAQQKKPIRWHIAVFLAPAVLVYTAVMIIPLFGTLQLSLFNAENQQRFFVGLDNFRKLFGDPRWSASFWNAASPGSSSCRRCGAWRPTCSTWSA